MNQDTYNEKFETGEPESKLLIAAFEQVSDIRKFEIELYWKRATYFWTLITVAFAGYFSILASEHIPNKFSLSLIVSSIGFVFTFAWFLSCRGSKYWQENWENHLDLLEDSVTGPLYKTILQRPTATKLSEKYVTGPLSVSVSKINQWVSIFVLISWLFLVAFSGYKSLLPLGISGEQWLAISLHLLIPIFTILSCFMMFRFGQTHRDSHTPEVIERKTEIL